MTAQKPWHKYCSELHLCHPHVKADGNGADLGPFLFYSPMSVTLSFLNLCWTITLEDVTRDTALVTRLIT